MNTFADAPNFSRFMNKAPGFAAGSATLFLLANKLAIGRLGIAATRKLGGSVQRNRAKRLIREVFRRNNKAAGFDVVIVPKRELLDASLTALEADYRRNLERSLRQQARSG